VTRPEDLRGQAREAYDTWTLLGMSPAQALAEVVAMGLVEADPADRLRGAFAATGMDAHTAGLTAEGRPGWREAAPPAAAPARFGARSAWSWESDDDSGELAAPARPTGEAPSPLAHGVDEGLRQAYERAVSAAQKFGGVTEEQAHAMVRRRMTEAAHKIVDESAKNYAAGPANATKVKGAR
jgi:hypothetical protein